MTGATAAQPVTVEQSLLLSPQVQGEMELMRRAQQGDREALSQLVMGWQDRVYNLMFRLTRNEATAMDLTQEAMARAIERLSHYRAEAAPFTWMFRLATNVGLSHLRQVKRRRTGAFPAAEGEAFENRLPAREGSPGERLQRQESGEQVQAALARLDEEDRSLLVLRDMEGMDYQALAELFEVPLGTLKSRLFRARLTMRRLLSEYMTA